MDSIVVTGAGGRAGRWVAARVAAEDVSVTCVDVDHPGFEVDAPANVDFRAADLANAGEVYDLFGALDPDAVVHFAAYPSPTRHAGSRVFANNTLSTYHVLDAAGRADARAVWASSESAYGYPFRDDPALPPELPITESHELAAEDPYGASKAAGEEVAKMVARRDGVGVVSLRPSWVQQPGEYACVDARDDLSGGVGNFWSYVDARDLADAAWAAVTADVDGHEAVNVAAADTYLEQSVEDACDAFFGEVPPSSLSGRESALSTEKARDVIDWSPSYGWRESADADVEPPALIR